MRWTLMFENQIAKSQLLVSRKGNRQIQKAEVMTTAMVNERFVINQNRRLTKLFAS